MTAIIGLKAADGVYIGADSSAQMGQSWITHPIASPKVFRVGDFLMGAAGSYRAIQLLRFHLKVAERSHATVPTEQYLVTEFIPAVRSLFKEHGLSRIESNEETGNQFLLGYRGELFTVGSDFAVTTGAFDFGCIGSGIEVALGAMDALEYLGPGNEVRRIEKALEITARYIANVGPPFHVEFLPDKESTT